MEHSIAAPDRFIGVTNVHDNCRNWFTDESIGIHDVKIDIVTGPGGTHEALFENMHYGWLSQDSTSNPDIPYFGYDVEQTPDGYMFAGCLNNPLGKSVDLLFVLDSADYWTEYTLPQNTQTCERSPQFFLHPYLVNWYGSQNIHEGMSPSMGTGQNHGEMEGIFLPASEQCVIVGSYSSGFEYSVIAYFSDYVSPEPPEEDHPGTIQIDKSLDISALQVRGTNRIQIRIESDLDPETDILLSLFDISGRLAGELTVEGSSLTENTFELNTSSIPNLRSNGVYLVQVKAGSYTGTFTTVIISW